MSDQEPGFKIQGEFYPWIGFDDWMLPDCRLVRRVTGYNETDLLRGKASNLLLNLAFAAVAFRRKTGASVEDTADVFDHIPPDQVEAVGFKPVEGDAGPPDVTPPGSEPSESGEQSSEEPPAT